MIGWEYRSLRNALFGTCSPVDLNAKDQLILRKITSEQRKDKLVRFVNGNLWLKSTRIGKRAIGSSYRLSK